MITSLFYYILTYKRRRAFKARAELFGEITIWNRKSAELLLHEQFKYEMASLLIWGMFFSLEILLMFYFIGTYNAV